MDVRAMANITQRQPAHGPAHGEKFLQRLGEMVGGCGYGGYGCAASRVLQAWLF